MFKVKSGQTLQQKYNFKYNNSEIFATNNNINLSTSKATSNLIHVPETKVSQNVISVKK